MHGLGGEGLKERNCDFQSRVQPSRRLKNISLRRPSLPPVKKYFTEGNEESEGASAHCISHSSSFIFRIQRTANWRLKHPLFSSFPSVQNFYPTRSDCILLPSSSSTKGINCLFWHAFQGADLSGKLNSLPVSDKRPKIAATY